METVNKLFERFDRLDTSLNRWLVAHSITLLRVSLGLVFILFGALKFFPGASPIEALATQTTTVLTFGMLPPGVGLVVIAALEVAIGLCFVTGRLLRVGVWLMGAQMLGAMSPLILFPGELFGPGLLPTLAAQYILKDIILVAAAMVIAATWSGARIVAEPRTMKSTLRVAAPRVVGENRIGTPRVPGLRRAENFRNYGKTVASSSRDDGAEHLGEKRVQPPR